MSNPKENQKLDENLQKQKNYRVQFTRLNKALVHQFYLEAVFIAYAIIEDRTEAVLRYEGKQINSKGFVSLDRKLRKIRSTLTEEQCICGRYFDEEILDSLSAWKESRNSKMHALMKGVQSTTELAVLAEEGKTLARALCTKASNYKRAVERRKRKTARLMGSCAACEKVMRWCWSQS